jgi:hypothetical protein
MIGPITCGNCQKSEEHCHCEEFYPTCGCCGGDRDGCLCDVSSADDYDLDAERRRFTREEAESKVGKRVKALVPFSGVPEGTTGLVVLADDMDEHDLGTGFDVAIEWELSDQPFGATWRPLRDWFDKDEYDTYLEELQS